MTVKNIIFLSFFLIFGLLTNLSWSQGSAADTTHLEAPEPPEQKQLPQIQLNEYTIVGLAKVTLPRKIRSRIFKQVKIGWAENPDIWQKASPAIAFQFARVKPLLSRLYEFPWFNSQAAYGSFNTMMVSVQSQFRIKRFLPYFSADFLNSDGHTENAQHSFAGLRSGFHYQLKNGQLLHLGTDYRFTKRGIWREADVYRRDWETQSTLWRSFASLEQRWSRKLSTRLEANYFIDDHENAFRYSDRGWNATANIALQLNKTRLEGTFNAETSDLTFADGNLSRLQTDSTALRKYESRLLGGTFLLQQQIQLFTLQAGVRYQQSNETFRRVKSSVPERNFIYPRVALTAKVNHRMNATVAYQPHVSMSRLRFAVRALPFSDLRQLGVQEYQSHWQASLNFDFPGGAQLNLSGDVLRVKDYFAPTAPSDSLPAVFNTPTGSYPGWSFSTIEEIDLREAKARFRWNMGEKLVLQGTALFRRSKIRKGATVAGKSVPYLPDLSAQGILHWKFFRNHRLSLSVNYRGKRYDDLLNQTRLADYLLVSAGVRLVLSQNVFLFVRGVNLLDSEYEQWRGFSAPGVHGFLGLRVVL